MAKQTDKDWLVLVPVNSPDSVLAQHRTGLDSTLVALKKRRGRNYLDNSIFLADRETDIPGVAPHHKMSAAKWWLAEFNRMRDSEAIFVMFKALQL